MDCWSNFRMSALSQQLVSVAIKADQSSCRLFKTGVLTTMCGTILGCPTDPVHRLDRGCASSVATPGANHPDSTKDEGGSSDSVS